MMTIQDTIRDPERVNQMKFVEFIVFLCRISHFHYEKTSHRKELLYVKLDHLIPNFLEYKDLYPTYRLGILFASEAKAAAKKYKKKKR